MLFKKLVGDFIAQNKGTFVVYLILVLLTFPTESVFLPQLYGKLFASVKNKTSNMKGGALKKISKLLNKLSTKYLIVLIIVVWIIVVICYYFKHEKESKIIPNYLSFVRKIIFTKTIENHADNYQDIKVGKHISRILDVSRNMRDCTVFVLEQLIPLAIAVFLVNIYFLISNYKVGLVSVAGITITIILLLIFGKRSVNASKEREEVYLDMSEKINDSFGNLMNVYLNNQNDVEINKNKELEQKHTDLYVKQLNVTRSLVFGLSAVSIVTFSAVLFLNYWLYRRREISGPQFITITIVLIYYLGYTMKISGELPHFLNKIGIIKNSEPFLSSIFDKKKERTKKDFITQGGIKFTDLSFKYNPKDKDLLLNDFNFEIKPKQKVAIVGSSGSGKTTLMKLMLAMHPIQSGDILIDDVSILTADLTYLRNNINYVNQRTILFNANIIENIKYGNNITDQEVKDLIKKYNLGTIYQELKHGLMSPAGVHGGNLSLGMQKVTMILRGIFKKGKIVIFDEPLSGLDPKTRVKIIKLIQNECKGKTVIVITHDKEIIPYMDKSVDINQLKLKQKTDKIKDEIDPQYHRS
jgi:ABC-type multidrug transport system fused ATPase/permease subunit